MARKLYRIVSMHPGYVLAPNGNTVRLEKQDIFNLAQVWELTGPDDQFTIVNYLTGQYMAYFGGNEVELQLVDDAPGGKAGFFSWGGKESWGASALQCFSDSGQNVDAGRNTPTTGNVRTRGWRHGNQRELTWIKSLAVS
ncbi:hypothetical protein [Archangium lansingense]|uniref:Uncharacterized protein n=1 Tax=Archangium lansingense TaxID=2995310 RepID=A0ABT4A5Y7_9BACT|nr:hypothetical protein [Archangium lansinium]MCY1077037.1 hypothetical protein [Archangium lansinium]